VLFAPQAIEREGEQLVRDVPMCLACADGEPCAAVKCAGQGRHASSTRIEPNVWGEVHEVGFVADVVHRTPEELGIPRTIMEAPPAVPLKLQGLQIARMHELAQDTERQARAAAATRKANRERPRLQTIRGVEVVMPAEASMGPEMIDLIADASDQAESEREREKLMPKRVPDEIREAIRSAPADVTNRELEKQYNLSPPTISKIRRGLNVSDLKKYLKLAARVKKHRIAAVPEYKASQTANGPAASVSIMPAARIEPVSGAHLQHAPMLGDRVTLALELTHGELMSIVTGLSAPQLAAALRAALTTPRA
jgi:hypothetical protein